MSSIVGEIDQIVATAKKIVNEQPGSGPQIQPVIDKMGQLRAKMIQEQTSLGQNVQARLPKVKAACVALRDQLNLYQQCPPEPRQASAKSAHEQLSGDFDNFVQKATDQIEGSFRFQATAELLKLYQQILNHLESQDATETYTQSLHFRSDALERFTVEINQASDLDQRANRYFVALLNLKDLLPAANSPAIQAALDTFRLEVGNALTKSVLQANSLFYSRLGDELADLNKKLQEEIQSIEEIVKALQAVSAILGIFDALLTLMV